MNIFTQKALEIIHNMKNKYVNSDGLISASYPPSRLNLLEHFDDYAPFLMHYGEDRFIKYQIDISRKFTYRGLLISRGRIVSYQNNEYLEALFDYYRMRKEDNIVRMLKESLEAVDNLLVNKGFICSYYDVKNNKAPSIASPMSGSLLEVFLNNHEFSPNMSKLSIQVLNNWLKIPFFQKFGLFPSKYFIDEPSLNTIFIKLNIPFHDKLKNRFGVNFCTLGEWANTIYRMPWGVKVQVSKDNTNFLFSLIEAYKVTHDQKYKVAITYWIRSLKQKLNRDGFIHRFWSPKNGAKEIELVHNFPVIDILCDVYYYVSRKKSFLNFAEEIALSWINKSMWPIGLFPKTYQGSLDHLDNQTDFCVSLIRLYELTGKTQYHDIAERVLKAILRYHYTQDGYVTSIKQNGEPANERIEPKYNALLLKALILFSEDKKIYGDDHIHSLMKDR